jgi:hypothetical protein
MPMTSSMATEITVITTVMTKARHQYWLVSTVP